VILNLLTKINDYGYILANGLNFTKNGNSR